MNWQAFYLGCFGVGLVLSLVSFLSGAAHLHLPVKWLHVKGGHSGPLHSGAAARGEVHHAAENAGTPAVGQCGGNAPIESRPTQKEQCA